MISRPKIRALLRKETTLTSRQQQLALSEGYRLTPDSHYYYQALKRQISREERRQILFLIIRKYLSAFLGTEYDFTLEERFRITLKKIKLRRIEELVELISAPETRVDQWTVFFNWLDLPAPSTEVDLEQELSRLGISSDQVQINPKGIREYTRDRRLSHLAYSALSTFESTEEFSSGEKLLRILLVRHYRVMGVRLPTLKVPLITRDRTEGVFSRPEKFPFLPRLPRKIYYHRKLYWKIHLRFSSHWNLSYWEWKIATVPKLPHNHLIVRKMDSVTNDRLKYIQTIPELISLRNYSPEGQKEVLTLLLEDLGSEMTSKYLLDCPEDQDLIEKLSPDHSTQVLTTIHHYRSGKKNSYFRERNKLYQILRR